MVLLFAMMLLLWQVMMWKKIKLKKWQDYTMSSIMIEIKGWLAYLAILCSPDIDALEQM